MRMRNVFSKWPLNLKRLFTKFQFGDFIDIDSFKMRADEQYLLVVSVICGRKFPKRPSQELLVESKFDGELLATDPVQHSESPEFHTELAWELSKKTLHQHRLQRTPIKLQCYSVNIQTKTRESIGYVVLDLRSALVKDAAPAKLPVASKWYNILNSKYHKHKPEIQLGISLELDTPVKDESFKARAAPPRKGQVPSVLPASEIDPSTLKAMLNNEEGFYKIGPEESCTESFVLSVTIAFAANLSQLVTPDIPLAARHKGFFFSYALLGNHVTNDSFHDLMNPTFPAERASVRLKSSVDILRVYFQREPLLQIHLCCGETTIGTADVRLSTLLQPGSDAINRQPLIIEGAFQILSTAQKHQKDPPVASSSSPCVGASVALRREEIPLQPQVETTEKADMGPPAGQEAPPTPPKKEKKRSADPAPVSPPQGEDSYGGYIPPQGSSRTEDDADTLRDLEEEEGELERQAAQAKRKKEDVKVNAPVAKGKAKPKSGPATANVQLDFMDLSVRHFCFSIDLRSIKDVSTPTNLSVYLRYTYPFFGSSSPVMTHPPVEVRRHTEVLLPHSFCAFDFATTPQQLRETLLRVPLLVEVWHRDKMVKDRLLGVARVPLSGIINADRARIAPTSTDAQEGWRQIFTERVAAETTEGRPTKMAELQVVLGLEDYGTVKTQEVYMGPGTDMSQTTSTSSSTQPPVRQQPPPPPSQAPAPPDPRETAEYKAAMELEMWKEQQAGVFENQMKEKELNQLQSLAEEFKRRDRERTLVLKKKTDEYAGLEEQLKFDLADVDRREHQLAANEAEVVRLRADLEREHQHKLVEMQEASRRLKEDCLHQIELEKSRVRVLEEEKKRLAIQLADADQRLAKKDQVFEQFKQESSSTPEIKLQAQINLLTLEKVELERKLESVTKSKIHYKQQWGRALKELARLKQREATEAKQRLKRQQQELEHMRLRYLAAEEKEVAKEEKKELQEIKGELSRLKDGELSKEKQQQQPTSQPGEVDMNSEVHPQGGMHHAEDAALEEHVARLIEERDTLLRTGVYTHQDRIISELDKQIRQAIAQKAS
ncbi:centrosomal protein of 120 kDa isoform X3 [Strongylocentrotus purpuratus]|uniref:C2 domain-containing protein n=1 Tax=Strongylocentrotus purpuratus TaxID=7668 RepID=A0A7M7N806_STRPU|nr:centrosomal protein of 120 kDa isoform X1 [Strongylocentrotus purpuratus]XP_030832369.1 centrosomal protein of 120 kDa isoform X2 [Strongylocentrotus purpuratus]XP_030832370.1 centrosomal protein of 120 kDa isoform X3 [Strongylocentrotus purpuratus]